jgi:hypothetical protein
MKIPHFIVVYDPVAQATHIDWKFHGASQIGACGIQIVGWPRRAAGALRHGDDPIVFSAENT